VISIAMDTSLDDGLRLEGKALDMIRKLNDMRKASGLELTDRIRVVLPDEDADLIVHAGWIKDEVLAVSLEVDGAAQEARIAKA
jgi:isoleucyl-tRNA synthetase